MPPAATAVLSLSQDVKKSYQRVGAIRAGRETQGPMLGDASTEEQKLKMMNTYQNHSRIMTAPNTSVEEKGAWMIAIQNFVQGCSELDNHGN
jgi:hypothetical protein